MTDRPEPTLTWSVTWNGRNIIGWRAWLLIIVAGVVPWSVGLSVILSTIWSAAR